MTGRAIEWRAAVEAAKNVASSLPETGKAAVLEHLLSAMTREAFESLSPAAKVKCAELLGVAVPVSLFRENFDALSVRVPINGTFIDVALPDETFYKTRAEQTVIAREIGGRMATRAENRAVAQYIIDQEKEGKITDKEAALLKVYRGRWVRDTDGGFEVGRYSVHGHCLDSIADPHRGALIVRSPAESK